MEKDIKDFKINYDQEIVITCGGLMDIIQGLSRIAESVGEISEKIPEEEARKILSATVVTYGYIVKLFPREERNMMNELLSKHIGIDLHEAGIF